MKLSRTVLKAQLIYVYYLDKTETIEGIKLKFVLHKRLHGLLGFFSFSLFVCVHHGYMREQIMAPTWQSEDTSGGGSLPPSYMAFWNQTHIARLEQQEPFPTEPSHWPTACSERF